DPARLYFSLIQPRDVPRLVDRPGEAPRFAFDAGGDGAGIDGVRREQAARVGHRAVGLDLLHGDHQRVARLRALDEERTGLRVGTGGDALAVPVHTGRIDRLSDH